MFVLANIFGVETWLIVLVVVLILFGGKKIPELMRGVGKGVGELQKGINEGRQHFEEAAREDPKPMIYTAPAQETQPRQAPQVTPGTDKPVA